MKLALREDMSRGGTLAEQLAWLDGLGDHWRAVPWPRAPHPAWA